jgi:DNA-binding transcriptional LysR family regulator
MDADFPHVRHLQALREVAECRRINVAAGRVHMSQPAVTQAIAGMERELGTPLFDRRPEGMFATEAGALFLHRVARALDLLKEGERQARRRSADSGRRDFHRLATPVQLRALVAVAETGSFSQAARHLGVSQPGVHRATRDLERLAGIALFEPVRRGVTLTPAAEAFVLQVRLAASEVRQGRYEVSELMGRDSTRIFVGAMPLSRTAILPEAIDRLLRDSVGPVQVQCIDAPYETLVHDLRFGTLDFLIGALRDPLPAPDVVQEPLFRDRLHVVAARDHPLRQAARPTLEDTLAYPWIAPPKPTPSGTYLFEHLRIPQRPHTPVRIVSSSMVLIRGLMMRGDYVTIMCDHQIAVERAFGFLAPLPIELENGTLDIGFTFRAGWQPTATQTRFLDLIRRAACQPMPGPPL